MATEARGSLRHRRALADDVERWLADEPVRRSREPVTAWAKRWMRRTPSRVTAAAVLLLATVAGLTIGTVLLNRSNRLLAGPTQRAENATKAAEQSARWPGMPWPHLLRPG